MTLVTPRIKKSLDFLSNFNFIKKTKNKKIDRIVTLILGKFVYLIDVILSQ